MARRRLKVRPAAKLAVVSFLTALMMLLMFPAVRAQDTFVADTSTTLLNSTSHNNTSKVLPTQNATLLEDARIPLPKHLKLDYWDHRAANKTSALLRNICDRPATERSSIDALTVGCYASKANWTELAVGLTCLEDIKDIYWQSNDLMPDLSHLLEKYLPAARLHLSRQRDCYSRHHGTRHFSLPLMGSPNLASVKRSIMYGAEPAPQHMVDLHNLVASCPNIRSLDLELNHEGCVVSDGQPYAFNFEDSEVSNLQMPVLHRLRLDGYSFDALANGEYRSRCSSDDEKATNLIWPFNRLNSWSARNNIPPPLYHSLQELREWMFDASNITGRFHRWTSSAYLKISGDYLRPIPEPCDFPCCPAPDSTKLNESNLQAWLNRTSFSNVTTLSLGWLDGTTNALLFPELDSLRDLTILGAKSCNAQRLLEHLDDKDRPLRLLELRNFEVPNNDPGTLTDVLSKSQSTISSLSLGFINYLTKRWPAQTTFVNASHLSQIATNLPNLTHLDIDIDRRQSPTALDKIWHTLAAFPKLQSLTLRAGSPGDMWLHLKSDQLFNASSLPKLTKLFVDSTQDRRNVTSAPSFRSLEVILGEWGRRDEISMVGPPSEWMGRYVCNVEMKNSEENTEEALGMISPQISCTGALRWPRMHGDRVTGAVGEELWDVVGVGWDSVVDNDDIGNVYDDWTDDTGCEGQSARFEDYRGVTLEDYLGERYE